MFLITVSPLPNNFGHYILHYCSVKFGSDLKLATKWGSDMDESVEMANQVTESSISPVGGYDPYCLQICIPALQLISFCFLTCTAEILFLYFQILGQIIHNYTKKEVCKKCNDFLPLCRTLCNLAPLEQVKLKTSK